MKHCEGCGKPIADGPCSFYCDDCEPSPLLGSCDACNKQLGPNDGPFCTWCLETQNCAARCLASEVRHALLAGG
jgi:hypothetical protein